MAETAQYNDLEEQLTNKVSSASQAVRSGFVQKVYGILTVQLLVTVGIAMAIPREFLQANAQPVYYCCLGGLIIVICAQSCAGESMRRFPTSYIWLGVITVLMSLIVAVVTSQYRVEQVLTAAGMTSAIFFGLTAYACVTKTDFTGFGPYLYAGCLGLMITGLVACIFPTNMGMTIQAGFGAILFSMYIVYDTQMIMGGRRKKHQFDIDDYAFAALNLYLDIINLFLYILELLNGDRK